MSGSDPERTERRDFLTLLTGTMLGLGSSAAAWPLLASLTPDAGAEETSFAYSALAGFSPGGQIRTLWRRRPVVVVWRTAAELAALEHRHPAPGQSSAAAITDLGGPPPYARNWHRSLDPEILVVLDHCTRFGEPLRSSRDGDIGAGRTGFFCLSCASHYDFAGRLVSGIAPADLIVPPHRFLGREELIIGEDPPEFRLRA